MLSFIVHGDCMVLIFKYNLVEYLVTLSRYLSLSLGSDGILSQNLSVLKFTVKRNCVVEVDVGQFCSQ